MDSPDDTIAAIASAPGSGRRGIVRLSGPEAHVLAQSLFEADVSLGAGGGDNRNPAQLPRACRHAGRLVVPGLSAPIPAALWQWIAGRSYTGQPVAELHLISSPPLLDALLQTLLTRGARGARPGEFTLRAFLSGRLDLLQAEAVLAVVDADDQPALRDALTQLAGGLSTPLATLREQLLSDLADLEAGLDFVDEDIEFLDRAQLQSRLQQGLAEIRSMQQHARQRGRSDVHPIVVLSGPPNAGKSTLFNALAGRDAAIVSPRAGTTRDVLRMEITAAGLPIVLVDTAGEQDAGRAIEESAQQHRGAALERADLILECRPAAAFGTPGQGFVEDRNCPEDGGGNQNRVIAPGSPGAPPEHSPGRDPDPRAGPAPRARPVLKVWTKADLLGALPPPGACSVSAHTGAGLDTLQTRIRAMLEEQPAGRAGLLADSLARCQGSLEAAKTALERASLLAAGPPGAEELVADELRRGLEALGELCGAIYTDDLLDRIFSRFCIGK